VELLHSHTTTQPHWSSGSTRGAAVRVPRMHPHSWNWDILGSVVSLQNCQSANVLGGVENRESFMRQSIAIFSGCVSNTINQSTFWHWGNV
jgi:hypothetical protein